MIRHLFSCSYATCTIPEAHRAMFEAARSEVESPAGWDPGVLNLGQAFAMHFRTPLVHGEVSRLLIDLEQEGDALWSRWSQEIPEASRARLADRHAGAFRDVLRQRIRDSIRRGGHLLHVFLRTHPGNDGTVDIETHQASALAEEIASRWSNHILGAGLYTRLRHQTEGSALHRGLAAQFPTDEYAQISLSVAQSFFLEGKPQKWTFVRKLVVDGLQKTCAELDALNAPEDSSSLPD